MTAVRSFLRNRIAILLVIVGMIMGFVVPSVCTDYYDDLMELEHNTHEIHILDIRGMRDCILEVSSSERIPAPVLVKTGDRAAHIIPDTASDGSLPGTAHSVCRLPGCMSSVTTLSGILTISFFIITTHLKDGNK